MFKKAAVVLIVYFLQVYAPDLQAQNRALETNYETWWGVMTSTQYSKRMSWWNDAHFVNNLFWIYRTGLTYHNKPDNVLATAGYSILNLGTPWSNGKLIRPEHRPWGQVVYRWKPAGKWSFSNRFRYDARFIATLDRQNQEVLKAYDFNHRFRFNMGMRYNLGNLISPKSNASIGFLNETLINAGSGPNGFPFEHRTHLMFNLKQGSFTYSLGYIGRYIEVNENLARFNHGLVVWLTAQFKTKKFKQSIEEFPGEHIE
jgi:hypothetical protein